MTERTGCLLCGAALAYDGAHSSRICALCGAAAASNARCESGHFVCDRCHGASAADVIAEVCRSAQTTSPTDLALSLMRSPAVHMHGPEHHFLVPAVLIAAYASARALAPDERDRLLQEARRRADVVRGGFCGLWGACGAGIGTGIFMSVVTGATPLARKEWRLANATTSAALARIAEHGGPRCCKRCTLLAIDVAAEAISRELEVSLDRTTSVSCEFSPLNRECLKAECPYYPAGRAGCSTN